MQNEHIIEAYRMQRDDALQTQATLYASYKALELEYNKLREEVSRLQEMIRLQADVTPRPLDFHPPSTLPTITELAEEV